MSVPFFAASNGSWIRATPDFDGESLFVAGNLPLAAVELLIVWGTIIWCVVAIWPHCRWVAFAHVPYLDWVERRPKT
ncbi:tryptophan-rich sensory protein [Lignipirellula cremea]|uniref:tryptophan-rich sensory protein n=1 Tax=Lignipirellula cremea TaxID=2528010 RepID=UPI001E4A01DF|nr:tryptophan-rich sensory protein [Lignipirellula cremea]